MGGNIRLTVLFGIIQVYVAGASYFMFVVPLVLFWPAEAQIRRWYVMLLLSALWLPVMFDVLMRESPRDLFRNGGILLFWMEMAALPACGLYLLPLRRAVRS